MAVLPDLLGTIMLPPTEILKLSAALAHKAPRHQDTLVRQHAVEIHPRLAVTTARLVACWPFLTAVRRKVI
jgi:hypothetical protein